MLPTQYAINAYSSAHGRTSHRQAPRVSQRVCGSPFYGTGLNVYVRGALVHQETIILSMIKRAFLRVLLVVIADTRYVQPGLGENTSIVRNLLLKRAGWLVSANQSHVWYPYIYPYIDQNKNVFVHVRLCSPKGKIKFVSSRVPVGPHHTALATKSRQETVVTQHIYTR